MENNELTLEEIEREVLEELRRIGEAFRRKEEERNLFLKYDVPRFRTFGSRGAYVEGLVAFMRVWREEVRRGRERGLKRLVDFPERERYLAIVTGFDISLLLTSYSIFVSVCAENWEQVVAKFEEVFVAVRFLTLGNSSAIIDSFMNAVDMIYHMWGDIWGEEWERVNAGGTVVIVSQIESKEAIQAREAVAGDLIHLILREVLRLEVAFYCPYVPPACSDEGFERLGKSLRDVFREKHVNVLKKMNELRRMCSARSSQIQIPWAMPSELLEKRLLLFWNEIELNPILDN